MSLDVKVSVWKERFSEAPENAAQALPTLPLAGPCPCGLEGIK